MTKLAAIVLLALAAPALADIEAGSWQLTVTASVEGTNLQPVTEVRCLTRADAADPSRLLGAGAGCQFSNQKDTGSQISFDVVCSGQMPMSGSGVMRYTPTNVDGTLELYAGSGNQRMATRSQLSGRRLGAC